MQEGKEKALSAEQVLRRLAERWNGVTTFSYRSTLVLSHQGEPGLRGTLHVHLRRPRFARIDVRVDNPEFCCLRVCDGRVIWHRNQTVPLIPATTRTAPFQTTVMADIPHPLDEASYSVDQFLAPSPFWVSGTGVRRTALQRRVVNKDGQTVEELEIVQTQGTSRDTLTLAASDFTPLRLVRVGDHGGTVQELLRETFHDVVFNSALPGSLFQWSRSDEARR